MPKQLQIENFIKDYKIDILNLQEVNIEEDTFSECHFISSNFKILQNNSENIYGTASLVKNEFDVENIYMYREGRVLIFEVGGITCGNLYIQSGTDSVSRKKERSL